MRHAFMFCFLFILFLFPEAALPEENSFLGKTEQENEKTASSYLYTSIEKVGFVLEKPAAYSATIVSTDADRFMITSDHLVYLKPEKGFELHPGESYMICAKPEILYSKIKRRKKAGYLHRISGIVEISEIREGLVIGTVTQAFLPIHIGDFLIPAPKRNPEISLQESIPGLEARILANDSGQVMCAQGDVVYIDKGKQDGLAAGQIYVLFEERKVVLSRSRKDRRMDKAPIGSVLILDVRESASAALVLDSRIDVPLGAPVGSPSKNAP